MTASHSLNRQLWEVRAISREVAERFIVREHYAKGAANTATYLHGLFRKGEIFDEQCLGIAWWIPPTKSSAQKSFPENWQGVLALSRLAIDDSVPRNGASFLLGKSMKMIDRNRWPCLVTYADEWRGHTGAIYRATNWNYVGKTKPERIYVKDGRMVARKAGPKTRTHSEMIAIGAECVGSFPKHKFLHVAGAA